MKVRERMVRERESNKNAAALAVMGVDVWMCSDVEKTTTETEAYKQKKGDCVYVCVCFSR